MPRDQSNPAKLKIEKVGQIKEQIKGARAIYFTDFTGLTVGDLNSLRRALKAVNGKYFVVKNRLAMRALKESEWGPVFGNDSQMANLFVGPTGLVMGYDDPVEPGKILSKTTKIKVKAALIENKIYQGKEYEYFVSLPSRATLLGQVVVSINQPLFNLVFVLNQLVAGLVYALDDLRKKKTGGSDVK